MTQTIASHRSDDLGEQCRFCKPPDRERIILSTPNFYVMLSLGPIVEGYSLIISRAHTDCCAAIPPAHLQEFLAILGALQTAQVTVFGTSKYYEHGRTGSCLPNARGEPHCHHAHLHCVPVAFDMFSRVTQSYPLTTLPSWEELLTEYAATPQPYLLVEREGKPSFAPVPDRIPRQFLRTVVADLIGEPHLSDWAAFQGWDRILLAKSRLEATLRRTALDSGIQVTDEPY